MTTTTNPLGRLGIDQSKILANLPAQAKTTAPAPVVTSADPYGFLSLPAQPTSYGGYDVWKEPSNLGFSLGNFDTPYIRNAIQDQMSNTPGYTGAPIVIGEDGKPYRMASSDFSYVVDPKAANPNMVGVYDTINNKFLGDTWRPLDKVILSGNDHSYTDFNGLAGTDYTGAAKYAPGSTLVLNKTATGYDPSGYYIANQAPLDWSTSNRNNAIYRTYTDPSWLKTNASGMDLGNGSAGYFINNKAAEDPTFGWKENEFRGEQFGVGGISNSLGAFGNDLLDVASFIPVTAPYAAAIKAAENVQSGNWGGAALNVLSIPGVSNYANNFLTTNISGPLAGVTGAGPLTPSQIAATKAINSGIISGAGTALSGGDIGQIVTNAIASGAGNYASGTIKDYLPNDLPKSVISGLTNAGVGALTSAIKGEDIGKGALISGASGVLGGLGKDISSATGVDPTSLVGKLLNNVPAGAIVSALAPETTSGGTPSSTTDGSPTVSGTTPSVPDVTPSVSGENPAAGGLASLGLPAIPWLASGPTMIGGGTSCHRSDKNPLYESAGNSLMEVKKGGLIGHYAAGGTGGITCLNQCPCYMPTYVKTGVPTMLESKKHDTSNTGLRMLHQLYPVISERGNMNELSKGGLPRKYAEAAPKGHKPEFITGLTGYYACGGGTGQSDDIPAMLHDGDYVMDAETVSALGDGSSKAGREVLEGFRNQVPYKETSEGNPVAAKIADGEYVFPAGFVTAIGKGDNKKGAEILDGLREKLRMHKRSAPKDKIPPKAKSPLDYIKKV